MHMRRSHFITGVFILVFISVIGCEPKRLGPEVRPEGVYFPLYAPEAKSVAIAGSFNQWEPGKDLLSGPDKRGFWSIVLPLREGRYEYLFVEDGQKWKLDPGAASVCFGSA